MNNRRVVDFSGLVEMGITYTARHLRRLVKAGKFPAPVKLGQGRGRNFWPVDKVAALLAEREREAGATR
jgi:hypothetical protein